MLSNNERAMQPQEHDYDIIGHPQCGFHFVVTFPFHAGKDGGQVGHISIVMYFIALRLLPRVTLP